MSSTAWQLDGLVARFSFDAMSATLDLARPGTGLAHLQVDAAEFPSAHLLAVEPVDSAGQAPPADPECYLRARDLVACYSESSQWPVHLDLLWRAVTPAGDDAFISGLELVVSVRSRVLDGHPRLQVRSTIPAEQVLRLAAGNDAEFEACDLGQGAPMGAAEGPPGCLLCRLPGSHYSYAEMVHPADFRALRVQRHAAEPELTCVLHELFPQSLEKGVLMRSRIRVLLLRREGDETAAMSAYATFAASAPPLGT